MVGADKIKVDLEKICQTQSEKIIPKSCASLEGWEFVIRPASEADFIARSKFLQGLGDIYTAEELELMKANPSARFTMTRNREIVEQSSHQRRKINYWDLRRYVSPPEFLKEWWDWSGDDIEKDPLNDLPQAVGEELDDAIQAKQLRSGRLAEPKDELSMLKNHVRYLEGKLEAEKIPYDRMVPADAEGGGGKK